MLSALAADRVRVADIEARILALEHSLAALHLAVAKRNRIRYLHTFPANLSPCPPVAGLLSPTVLTHICRKWRQIALTTPGLWRAISLSHRGTPRRPPADLTDVLIRSGRCPLSIAMDEYDYHRSEYVFSTVVTHRERWEYLKLYICSSDFPAIKGRLHLLRHVDLTFDDDPPAIMLGEAPLLRTAILSATEPLNVILPWAQLTSLTLALVDPYTCAPVLQQTSNLVHCKLRFYDLGSDESNPPPDVTLPSLESLILIDHHEPLPGYLNTFVVPALRSLRIPEPWLALNPIASLASFISKSGCKLQDLHIAETFGSGTTYRRAFPSIQNFSFDVQPDY
ncbi:hypothetical protein B0H13DRAFT_2667248 [Mycena leptocephala]|nr:hypothetical protein B0H13DRAFT_2667248 [Mycena leptocephala]